MDNKKYIPNEAVGLDKRIWDIIDDRKKKVEANIIAKIIAYCPYCNCPLTELGAVNFNGNLICEYCLYYATTGQTNLETKTEKISECYFCKKDIFKGEHFSEVLVDDYGNKFVYYVCLDCLKKKTYNTKYGIKDNTDATTTA